jgi:carbamoyl-phosphate synthase large subunit
MRREAVLVTAAGSIIGEGIIKCLRFANTAQDRSFSYEIVTTDMKADAAGLFRGDHGELVPSPLEEAAYYARLAELSRKYSVRAIFPGSDEELLPLAAIAPKLEKETEAKVITNPLGVLKIAMDKWKTFASLKREGLDCAESCLPDDKREFIEKFGYPLIVKPRVGHGSNGLFLVKNTEELDVAIINIMKLRGEPVIQEYLPDEDLEYTTGITMNENGAVLSTISLRRKLKHGQTYKAFVEDVPSVRRSSEKAVLVIGGRGPVNVQSRIVNDRSKVFEVNPRFSASCPIRAVAGVNEPDIVFRDQVLKERIYPRVPEKLVALRYWNEIYVPQETMEKAMSASQVNVSGSFVPDYF